MPRTDRRAELDLARTVLVFAVVVFHGLRVFDPFDFYVKGPRVDALAPVILLGGLMGMPLFFVLAGVSLWHSMGRRPPGALARERVRRLGVPFVVAVVVLVPPQVHVERLQAGTAGTYWDTLRDFFDVRLVAHFPIPIDGHAGGPFEPAHVWFLGYLLVFTLVLLPFLWPLRRDAKRGAALARRLGTRCGLLLAMLAVGIIEGAHAAEDAGGWSRWAYPLFLVFGFLLAADPSPAQALVTRRGRLALAAATAFVLVAATGAALHDRLGDELLSGHAAEAVVWRVGQGVAGCLLVAAILGALLGRSLASRVHTGRPALAWARTVTLPVYIVHQTVGVICAYVVLRLGMPVGIALVAIVVTTTALSVLIAEALGRTPLRAAFGLAREKRNGPSDAPGATSPELSTAPVAAR
jgi:glucans biosynthesis protein C